MRSLLLAFVLSVLFSACALAEYVEHRPGYHFTPPTNWMNDPNGPVYFNGLYHLFYQYNPNHPYWGDMHWGHAYSTDLVNWNHLPIALFPDEDYDTAGVFTGSITIDENGPVIIYTAVAEDGTQTQALAFPANISDPYLVDWVKYDNNPVIRAPHFVDSSNFRDDTTAWFNGVSWSLLVGASSNATGDFQGAAAIFSAPSLTDDWTFSGFLHTNNYSGIMWECPDFFPIDPLKPTGIWVFKASCEGADFWTTGKFNVNTNKYTLLSNDIGTWSTQLYDAGYFYASKSFYDPVTKYNYVFGWIVEGDDSYITRGWASVQSLPRKVSLDTDGVSLLLNPVDAIKTLRSSSDVFIMNNMPLIPRDYYRAPLIGDQLEINFNVSIPYPLSPAAPSTLVYGVDVRASSFREEWTTLSMEIDATAFGSAKVPVSLTVVRANSTLNTDADLRDVTTTFFADNTGNKTGYVSFHFRAFVDHSVLEVFAQSGRGRIATRIYPSRVDSLFVDFFSYQRIGGEIVDVSMYQMNDSMPPPPIN